MAQSTIAFLDGGNPWATVVTDARKTTKRAYFDAYGRMIQTTDVSSGGNINTKYIYDLVGNLTNVTDDAGTNTVMTYDSLGRKLSTMDADMGVWTYAYDNAGRMTQQTDARTNTITFNYTDEIGRLFSKQIFKMGNTFVGAITNIYDTSDDPVNFPVYKGQLYKVIDLQGYERHGYDVRDRETNSGRYLSVNKIEYLTHATYDDADRVQQLTYPGNCAKLQYSYDVVGHLSQVQSLSGTGTTETFYVPQSYNALNQLSGYTCGNGVATTYSYYANSKRLQNLTTAKGVNTFQNLSYTYDAVSDVASIVDAANPAGISSASLSNIKYDDFYRVTSLSGSHGSKRHIATTMSAICCTTATMPQLRRPIINMGRNHMR